MENPSLNLAQTQYTTTERELLSIVKVLKEFRNILLGQQICVHTDHENLTYKMFNSDRVMQWRLYIKEYSPELQYRKGESNVVADALSRLDMDEEPSLHDALITEDMCLDWFCYAKVEMTYDSHPLSFQHLEKSQNADKSLKKILLMENLPYQKHSFHGGITKELICKNAKIVVPSLLQKHVIDWYHTVLCHLGMNQTEETLLQHLW